MAEVLETVMVVCFGISWPVSIAKSYKSRSTKGKSVFFLIMIFIGYLCGILSKIISHNITYVFVFYVLNSIMVLIDIALFMKNKKIEKAAKINA